MRYVITDLEGASRGHFDDFMDVVRAIREIHEDDAGLVGELAVLPYDDQGHRYGAPIDARQLAPYYWQTEAGSDTRTVVKDFRPVASLGTSRVAESC